MLCKVFFDSFDYYSTVSNLKFPLCESIQQDTCLLTLQTIHSMRSFKLRTILPVTTALACVSKSIASPAGVNVSPLMSLPHCLDGADGNYGVGVLSSLRTCAATTFSTVASSLIPSSAPSLALTHSTSTVHQP